MTDEQSKKHLDTIVRHVVATEAVCEKSVLRRALGLHVRGRVAARIDRALEAAGFVRSAHASPPHAA